MLEIRGEGGKGGGLALTDTGTFHQIIVRGIFIKGISSFFFIATICWLEGIGTFILQ